MELTYRAFGLTLGSELALPGLPLAHDEPVVWIRRGATPEWQGVPTIQYGERFRIRGQECSIHFKAQAFSGLVRDGNLIQFEADPTQDELSALHVLGSCTGILLFQRGLVPLHGNTIADANGAAMISGRIRAGKSATTCALLQRGFRLVADDISAVSFETNGITEPRVVPGVPRLKLWRATLDHFGRDYREFRRLRPGLDKFHYPADDRFCTEPQPLKAIYILQPGDVPRVRIHALSGLARLEALRIHLYKVRFPDAVRNWPPLLSRICRLADAVRVNIVERPREGDTIDAVADAIGNDFSGSVQVLASGA